MSVVVAATDRLVLRELELGDADFIRELVNEPGWLRYIGDRQVHSREAAENYLRNGPIASYARHGFGLNLVSLKDGIPIGICGLIKRDALEDVDLGFALLARHEGRGYAREAAAAIVRHAIEYVRLRRLAAVTQPDNAASIRLLSGLGFRPAGTIRLQPHGAELLLHVLDLPGIEATGR